MGRKHGNPTGFGYPASVKSTEKHISITIWNYRTSFRYSVTIRLAGNCGSVRSEGSCVCATGKSRNIATMWTGGWSGYCRPGS